ncbi:MAG: class I SAM-dependent methyltransferase [Candidatus Omnitrophica bacterium]|nr:class I SAM-dependent methyltransferase [Candidatus Omnitrophota bacterium]
MKKEKRNLLREMIIKLCSNLARGKILDIGTGDGEYAKQLYDMGFEVVACDIDNSRFKYLDYLPFRKCDITKVLPFADESFDIVLLVEVIEHLRNPYEVLQNIHRVIKPNGFLIISTPNILSIKSRIRYLLEGNYEYFREPPLEQSRNPKANIFNLHIFAYRYHELEYLLCNSGFKIDEIFTSVYEGYWALPLVPFIVLQTSLKAMRAKLKGADVDYNRIKNIILSKELLFGRHLILKVQKA